MNIGDLLQKDLTELCSLADDVRKDNVGDIVHIRALLEISNICKRNCDYCGLRCENKSLARYAMTYQEIEDVSKTAFDFGYKTVVLQGGESNNYDIGKFADMVHRIAELGITVTLSLGELSYSQLKILKEAGAKRYLLKFETADSKMYESLHKGYTLQSRLNCLSAIRELGYEVGSGFLVGLPNENEETVIKNLQLLKDLKCDMAGIGVFIPHTNTPLGGSAKGDAQLTKKCVAIARLLLPKCNIPITTSLGEFGSKYEIFSGGANVIMQNVTPQRLVNNYQIYPKAGLRIDIAKDRAELEKDIYLLGKKPL